mgnify:CR=1 FL=1
MENDEGGPDESRSRDLYDLVDWLRIIAILISPVLPKAAHGIFDQLNWKMELSGKEARFSLAEAEWEAAGWSCRRETDAIVPTHRSITLGLIASAKRGGKHCGNSPRSMPVSRFVERSAYITADTLQTPPVYPGERQALRPQSAMNR